MGVNVSIVVTLKSLALVCSINKLRLHLAPHYQQWSTIYVHNSLGHRFCIDNHLIFVLANISYVNTNLHFFNLKSRYHQVWMVWSDSHPFNNQDSSSLTIFLFYLHPPSTFFLTLLPFWTSWAISLIHSSCWAYMLGIGSMVLWLVKLFGDHVASPIQARASRVRGVELVELCGSGGELATYLPTCNIWIASSGVWLGLAWLACNHDHEEA
jgi:hypothetical protein